MDGAGRVRARGTVMPGHGRGALAMDSARVRRGRKNGIGRWLGGICPVYVPGMFYKEGWVLARDKVRPDLM